MKLGLLIDLTPYLGAFYSALYIPPTETKFVYLRSIISLILGVWLK